MLRIMEDAIIGVSQAQPGKADLYRCAPCKSGRLPFDYFRLLSTSGGGGSTHTISS
jgi:hypothetical protein